MRDRLHETLAALLPPELEREARDHIEAAIRANFERMDLVTRERFEIQEKVLRRTRERLHELERQVAEMERELRLARSGGMGDDRE
ncbi:MAG: accessory factor UbiK family protein [bacterium]